MQIMSRSHFSTWDIGINYELLSNFIINQMFVLIMDTGIISLEMKPVLL